MINPLIRSADNTGALPLHWAMRNTDIDQQMIDILIKYG